MRGKLGLVLMGGDMLSKSLIQFSVDGWGCVAIYLGPKYGDRSGGLVFPSLSEFSTVYGDPHSQNSSIKMSINKSFPWGLPWWSSG